MNAQNTVEKIADKAESATEKVAGKAQDAAEKVADKAERTVESARLYANEALDKADAKVRSLREDVQPAIDAISARVQDMAETAKVKATETADYSRERFNDMADRTSAYVQEQPLKSMAMAAAAGAVLAMLMGRRRR